MNSMVHSHKSDWLFCRSDQRALPTAEMSRFGTGARRLHTVLEKVMEDISYNAHKCAIVSNENAL